MKYSNTCSSVKGVVEILVEEDALSLDGLEAMRGLLEKTFTFSVLPKG